MKFTLQELARALGAATPQADVVVEGWSVDSRTLKRGDLFFALRGPRRDGHDFVAEAFAKGAAAAVVERAPSGCEAAPLLVVADTQTALENLAAWARRRWGGEVVAVTGSAGKTTTKDVIAAMLAVKIKTGKTEGNLNNHVGAPLSILRLAEDCQAAVLELGMNHAGELRRLAQIALPRVGVVTNVGYAHIENFDSLEGVAAAKRELVEALPTDGVAVLNADDERVAAFATACRCRVVLYGTGERAQVRAEHVELLNDGVRFRVGGVEFESRLLGRHGVRNLLAGVATASAFGIALNELTEAARAVEPGPMRGRRFQHNGILHIDDCYNANPDAVKAMLDVLAETPAQRRIAVLGEMLELGRWTQSLHREVGRWVAASGVDVLVGIRGAARDAVDAAREAGMPAAAACFFETPEEAGRWVKQQARPGDAVLWKGSRGVRVEAALQAFLD